MITVEAVGAGEESARTRAALRRVLHEYEQFLQKSGPANFNFVVFAAEIATAPAAYAERGGEMLLATVDGAEAGCIAYRSGDDESTARSCEIKRLFVLPNYRSCGLGKRLVTAAMERAAARGYKRAYLDTDIQTMPAAFRTYSELGFKEYARTESAPGVPLVFLDRELP
jgi:ribosomal protein S18 acetylase RimI-like enzyme